MWWCHFFGGGVAKKKCKIQPTGAYRVGNKRVEQFVTVAVLDVCFCCVDEMLLLNLSVSKQKVDLNFPHQQTTHGHAGDLSANLSHFQQSQRIIQMDQSTLCSQLLLGLVFKILLNHVCLDTLVSLGLPDAEIQVLHYFTCCQILSSSGNQL